MEKSIKQKILIVEDESSQRIALADTFVREDFHVFAAKDGSEGLVVALREHPDLTLIDIVMPVMDGITMLSKLREDVWGKNAKVIMLTNLSDALEHGSYDYLVKSDWKLEDVVARVRARLDE